MAHTRIRRYLRHGTLPQLAVFEAAARLSSITRAAEELHVTQPTASIQLKKLADLIGVPLFEHVGRRVRLTEAGERLQAACRDLFATIEALDEKFAALRAMKAGRLKVATSDSAGHFVARMLDAFGALHPGIHATLWSGNRSELVQHLADGDDDLFVLANPSENCRVIGQAIVENPLVAFANSGHRLARERRVPLHRLAQEPFLMREQGSGTRMEVESLFARSGVTPKVKMVMTGNDAIRRAVAADLGISILPRYPMQGRSGTDELVVLDVEQLPLQASWHVVQPAGRQQSPIVSEFVAFMRLRADDLVLELMGRPERTGVAPHRSRAARRTELRQAP